MLLHHDDSTTNIVLSITIIIIPQLLYQPQVTNTKHQCVQLTEKGKVYTAAKQSTNFTCFECPEQHQPTARMLQMPLLHKSTKQ